MKAPHHKRKEWLCCLEVNIFFETPPDDVYDEIFPPYSPYHIYVSSNNYLGVKDDIETYIYDDPSNTLDFAIQQAFEEARDNLFKWFLQKTPEVKFYKFQARILIDRCSDFMTTQIAVTEGNSLEVVLEEAKAKILAQIGE